MNESLLLIRLITNTKRGYNRVIQVDKAWGKWIGIVFLMFLLLITWFLRSLVVYVLISGVLSITARPIVNLLNKLKVKNKSLPNGLTAFVALIVIWGVIVALVSIVIPLAAQEIRVLSSLDYDQIANQTQRMLSNFDGFLRDYGLLTGEGSSDIIKNKVRTIFSLDDLTSVFGGFVSGIGNVFIAFFSVSFITFFFLKEDDLFKSIIMALIPEQYQKNASNIFVKSQRLLSRYFIGVFIEVCLISILVTTGLSLAGVNNAFIIGLFAGLINIIPYVGPLIGASVGIVVAFTSGLDPSFTGSLSVMIFKVVAVFGVVQLLDNALFQPLIFSNSVNAHPLEIFLVISMAGMLGGIPSMILAVPGYTFLRIIAQEFLSEFKIVKNLTKNI